MVKAKTDPEAPEAVLRLLRRIDALHEPPIHAASSSTQSAPPLDTSEALSLLTQCLDLTLEAPDELSASFKYGLDALRLWATQLASLLSRTSASSFDIESRLSLFPEQQQLALADVVWSACHSERTQVSSRTKTVLEAVISLLNSIHHPSQTPSKQFPEQSAFLTTLVGRALSQLERKQSPIVLEVVIANYGSAPFLAACVAGSHIDDVAIYDRMIRGLGTVDGGANRRSRLALNFLVARAADLGCSLRPSTSKSQDPPFSADASSPSWQAWSRIWILALTSALQQGGERLRSGLASYHLASLFDLDRRIFPALLNHLIARSSSSPSSDASIDVESVFLVLRIAKLHGLCRIDATSDFAIDDPAAPDSPQVRVPASLLTECILAAASELQISALSLVIESKTPAAPLSSIELDILRTFFPHSLTITNAAARGELRGFFVKLLTRLRASTYALARDIAKITRIDQAERYPHEQVKLEEMQQAMDGSRGFLEWMVQLVRATLHPGASYQASITSLTFLDLILESGADPSFSSVGAHNQGNPTLTKNAGMSLNKSKQVFSQDFPFSIPLITPSLVQQLLACSESTYDDIQARALTILSRFPAPLAGLETAQAAAQRLLGRSAELLTSTRESDSAAASKLLQLYRTLYMQQLDHQPPSLLHLVAVESNPARRTSTHTAVSLIFDLFDFLDYQISVAESGEILIAATSHPLHGTLVALQELFSSVAVHALAGSERKALRDAVFEAQRLIDRVWCITKAVLCNSAPEGSTQAEAQADPNIGLDQPASHETALAMQAAREDDKLAFMQPQEESNAGPNHQVILSYSWRGMKEASALLGVLVATCLAPLPVQRGQKGLGQTQPSRAAPDELWREIWDVQDIEAVGERFNRWLTQVRHRGAFSTIYPAYANAATAIVQTKAPIISELPQRWISAFLETVAQSGAQLSITRRSAGIGYAVLALVSAQPNKIDASVLQTTVERLMQIATQYSSQPDIMPVASIHALNILRVLVMDGGLTGPMAPYLGLLLELTISTFRSRFWGLRNVSMMLFSSLSIKIFGSRNTNKDTKEARMPVDDFFAAYPQLDAFLQRILGEAQTQDDIGDEGLASSLFAVVMLFSRMQAPESEPQRPGGAERMSTYRSLLSKCLDNKVWKVREVAVKAYAAFVPLRGAAQHATSVLESIRLRSQNEAHGKLMLAQRLLKSAGEAEVATSTLLADMSILAATIADMASALLELNRCAVTQAAFLEVVQDFVGIRDGAFRDLGQHLLRIVDVWISTSLSDVERPEILAILGRTPGGPALASTCARLQLQAASRGTATASFIDACVRHIESASHDVRISSLEALIGDDGIDALQRSSLVNPGRLSSLVRKLHAIVQDQDEGIWHRVHSATLLHGIALRTDADGKPWLSHAFSPDALVGEVSLVAGIAKTTTCVPFREALLPYLADLCKLLVGEKAQSGPIREVLQQSCWIIAECADEHASVQSREAACQALRVLGALLFPRLDQQPDRDAEGEVTAAALFKARIAAISLLTDDDEDVRAEASALIGETGAAVAISQGSCNSTITSYETIREMARRGGAGPDVSTERAWSWMAAFYNSERSGNAQKWTDYVWEQLMPAAEALEAMFGEALAVNTLLFADEKPNQFRDPESTLRLAAKYADPARLQGTRRIDLQERLAGLLSRLEQALKQTSRRNEAAAHLLAMHLLLTHMVLAKGTDRSSGPLAEAADSIASALGIDQSTMLPLAPGAEHATPTHQEAEGSSKPLYNIAMVSDFFYPNVGGVEGHIYFLGEQLLSIGHKVIVITHAYAPDRVGVRYLSNGLKVYYVPYRVIARQDTLPNFFSLFPILRSILIREQIQIVHGHQALSSMAHEGILHARTMGLRAVFTDHSLFGFSDTASILTNKLLRFVLSDIDGVVCVSHTGKENTTLRANLDPSKVSVIPNAVVAEQFRPDVARVEPGRLTVVVLSRLMYRKGIDLLIAAIPRLCAAHSDLRFVIGGDGPKRVELEQMRERHLLQDRVELCGAVRQGEVREHLTRGSIFLNTSLTEAFGTGLIEAACAGLFVVSTRVGGIPEVLPPQMIRLARPEEDDVVQAMHDAIAHVRAGKHDPLAYHAAVKQMYSWTQVAQRLEKVYFAAMQNRERRPSERLGRYYAGGWIAGKIFVIIVAVDMLFLKLLEWWLPDHRIDRCPDRRRDAGAGIKPVDRHGQVAAGE